jgi:transposase-like protein
MPRPYPKEFREGALQLVREGDRSIVQIARDLGIAESCLRRWIKQAELDRDGFLGAASPPCDSSTHQPSRGSRAKRGGPNWLRDARPDEVESA